MGRLTLPSADNFRGPAASLYGSVSLNMDPGDGMFHGNSTHYLTCGASAFNTITAAIGLGQIEPDAFLDFGSGSGRVTRWLRAAYPVAKIDACDIRASDLEFCASEFAANTWISGTDIDALKPPSSYDVIWVGSVVTHLSAERSERLVKQLFSWLNPNGIVVLSFHGRFAQIRGPGFGHYGLGGDWDRVEQEYFADGYGYADYPGQVGYGISLTSLRWATGLADRVADARLLLLSERAWDNHHDILALQNKAIHLPV